MALKLVCLASESPVTVSKPLQFSLQNEIKTLSKPWLICNEFISLLNLHVRIWMFCCNENSRTFPCVKILFSFVKSKNTDPIFLKKKKPAEIFYYLPMQPGSAFILVFLKRRSIIKVLYYTWRLLYFAHQCRKQFDSLPSVKEQKGTKQPRRF